MKYIKITLFTLFATLTFPAYGNQEFRLYDPFQSNHHEINLTSAQCSSIKFQVNDSFSFIGYSHRVYVLHKTVNNSTTVIDTKEKKRYWGGNRTNTLYFNVALSGGNIATYHVKQGSSVYGSITIKCANTNGAGAANTGGGVATPNPYEAYCPAVYPNLLGNLSNKSVCMAKYPNRIKSEKCNKKKGMKWNSAAGKEYCLWGKSNYWHARPTK